MFADPNPNSILRMINAWHIRLLYGEEKNERKISTRSNMSHKIETHTYSRIYNITGRQNSNNEKEKRGERSDTEDNSNKNTYSKKKTSSILQIEFATLWWKSHTQIVSHRIINSFSFLPFSSLFLLFIRRNSTYMYKVRVYSSRLTNGQ